MVPLGAVFWLRQASLRGLTVAGGSVVRHPPPTLASARSLHHRYRFRLLSSSRGVSSWMLRWPSSRDERQHPSPSVEALVGSSSRLPSTGLVTVLRRP